MEQVQMEYWEMDIWKVNGFSLLNEEVDEFCFLMTPHSTMKSLVEQ